MRINQETTGEQKVGEQVNLGDVYIYIYIILHILIRLLSSLKPHVAQLREYCFETKIKSKFKSDL